MRLELRMKYRYLEPIYQRYHRALKRSKGRIPDELCKNFRKMMNLIEKEKNRTVPFFD